MKECYLEINAAHLKSNFKWYKSQTSSSFICPMIKANAYGVGDKIILNMLVDAGAQWVGVVRLSEAEGLRNMNSNIGILLFNPCDEKEYEIVLKNNITPVISNFAALNSFAKALQATGQKRYCVHIEVDTGMNRLGFRQSDLKELFERLRAQNEICVSGVFTHLYHAEDWPVVDGKTDHQIQKFVNFKSDFESFARESLNEQSKTPIHYHVSNSRALNDLGLQSEKNKNLQQFGFRPGLGLYGVSQVNKSLKTVLTVKAPIVALKWIEAGETVSYDGVWVAQRRSLIGTLPIGYADGYPRALSNKFYVLVNGKKAPVVGKICMDFMMIDLTEFAIEDLSLSLEGSSDLTSKDINLDLMNEQALIFGEQGSDKISLDEFAESAGMISYEVLTGLSLRMKRFVVEK